MSNCVLTGQESLLDHIRGKYGALLTLEEVAEILRYRSVDAVRKAHSRNTLAVPLYRFPGRAGYFARAEDMVSCINKMSVSESVQVGPISGC